MTEGASWGATEHGTSLHVVIPLNGARWSLCGLKRSAWYSADEVGHALPRCSRCLSIRGREARAGPRRAA